MPLSISLSSFHVSLSITQHLFPNFTHMFCIICRTHSSLPSARLHSIFQTSTHSLLLPPSLLALLPQSLFHLTEFTVAISSTSYATVTAPLHFPLFHHLQLLFDSSIAPFCLLFVTIMVKLIWQLQLLSPASIISSSPLPLPTPPASLPFLTFHFTFSQLMYCCCLHSAYHVTYVSRPLCDSSSPSLQSFWSTASVLSTW